MAGDLPPAGRPRASLTRVAARLTNPFAYLAVLGGLQVLLLWTLRAHVGTWLAAVSTACVLALLGLLVVVEGRWRLKLGAVGLLGALTAVGPTLVAVIERPRIGLTMEHDGLLQIELAIDRMLNGQAIYGVDWSNTAMARLPWDLTPGANPALHHLAYFPLTVLVGVPFRLLTRALGLPFDYRMVLIGFSLVGLLAILALPIAPDRRFMVITVLFVSPLVTLYLWSGRTDIEFLALVVLSLALLSRGHAVPAAATLGIAVALKPFAVLAVPFLLLVPPHRVASRTVTCRGRIQPRGARAGARRHHPAVLRRQPAGLLDRRRPVHHWGRSRRLSHRGLRLRRIAVPTARRRPSNR